MEARGYFIGDSLRACSVKLVVWDDCNFIMHSDQGLCRGCGEKDTIVPWLEVLMTTLTLPHLSAAPRTTSCQATSLG